MDYSARNVCPKTRGLIEPVALILRSSEHPMWDVPRVCLVERVVRGRTHWLKQYAQVELVMTSTAEAETVVVTRRGSNRWRLPRANERMEVLLWDLSNPDAALASGRFDQPSHGASICYFVEDSLDSQMALWSRRLEGN
ncbi:hypothetical protein [Knoellia koreensis]|uniref:Uncharacterized protein n=1 Tax=Knoellia koreensis TaxID=2730921 RepID=A0A849H8Z7_9MICO|nr:hypothetical protein [Knoellia sp. DB2414S]NNM44405.1 hypothetical protein [Knoellia sp. DB2414S]